MSKIISPAPRTACLLWALVLLAGLHTQAAAQSTGDGSIYSRFGVGELRSFISAQSQAMGGSGVALYSYNYLNVRNPASWANQALTRVSAGVLYQGLEATDATDNVSRLTEGSLNSFQFAFPILSQRLGFAAAFEPYSRVSYRVRTEGSIPPAPVLNDTNLYVINLKGSGGLQRITGGLGYRLGRNVSVGASANVIFGILEDARQTIFLGPGYQPSYVATGTRLSGVTGTVGALVNAAGPFAEADVLSFGASFTLPAVLDGSRVRTLGEGLDRDTLGAVTSGSVTLPLSTHLGAAYFYDNRWTFVADALYEPWSDFESEFSLGGYEPGGESRFNDRIRASVGAEFLPAGADPLEPFLSRVAYRLGFYYDQSYVSPMDGVDLRTLAVTGGFGLPTLLPGTRIDIGFEVGTRGTTDRNLVQDRFYRVSASLNFGERWFEKRKLR